MAGNLILPRNSIDAQTVSKMATSKKLNTRLPPNTIEWYFQASSGVMPILLTAMAQGRTQQRFETSDW